MHRLAGRLGSGTRAGSWGSWLGGTPARLGCRSRADWRRRLLLEQKGEISHLLLQGGDLGLQGGKPLWERQKRSRKLRRLGRDGGRRHFGQESQAALMQAGQDLQVITAYPFFAAILVKAVLWEFRLYHPAVQRFVFHAHASRHLGHRDESHRITPF